MTWHVFMCMTLHRRLPVWGSVPSGNRKNGSEAMGKTLEVIEGAVIVEHGRVDVTTESDGASFAGAVLSWALEDARLTAMDDPEQSQEVEFTLYDDELSRDLKADLIRFHDTHREELSELAWLTGQGDVNDLDAKAYMSLVGHGSGLWDLACEAGMDHRDHVEALGDKLHDALIDVCGIRDFYGDAESGTLFVC